VASGLGDAPAGTPTGTPRLAIDTGGGGDMRGDDIRFGKFELDKFDTLLRVDNGNLQG
jgi:hypothetical protein